MPLRTLLLLSSALLAAGTASAPQAPAGAWRVEPGAALETPRAAHQASLLDSEHVLLTGGCRGPRCTPVERSSELLDTRTGASTPAGAMGVARVAHAAARLSDGRVLVVGGWTGSATTASAERFDPRTRRFSPLAAMASARMDATATALDDGSVLVVGGASATNRPLDTAERFANDRFEAVASLHEPRAHHATVRLADGRVLVVGGQSRKGVATASAEIFDPASGTFSRTGSLLAPRCKHAAVLLRDQRVMVIAGSSDCGDRHRLAQTEIYDPRTGGFTAGPSLLQPRYKIVSAAAVMPDGTVVVAGDANEVEMWTPGSASFVSAGGTLGKRLAFSTATALPDGRLLVVGGYDHEIRPTAQTWLVSAGRAASAVRR